MYSSCNARAVTLEQLSHQLSDGEWRRGLAAAPSGFTELDASLPGGWPMGVVCELMPAVPGIGELGLLLPALSQLAQAGRHIAWIAPPHHPYAPALAQHGIPLGRVLVVQTQGVQESLWAAEQALRCPAVGAVLSWPAVITDKNVRRLQLAAEAGSSLGILYRPAEAAREPSPAAIRLRLQPTPDGLSLAVEVQKCRGGRAGASLRLPLPLQPTTPQATSHALAVHSLTAAGA
ncbi:MAG: translesion DNA synthesis-associated protein ImuA [Steroidobacteraceae bacterium]